jgi:hypothetical protein
MSSVNRETVSAFSSYPCYNGEWTNVSWKTTADIEADPGVAAAIDEGLVELKEGLGVGWSSLRQELDLWRLGRKRCLNES